MKARQASRPTPFLAIGLIALGACAREPEVPASATSVAADATKAIEVRLPDGSTFTLPASPRRILPANTAAAEFVAPLVGAQRIAALPEQVDRYSDLGFQSDGYEKVPRFDRYHAEPLIVLHPDLVVTHQWQAAETSEVLRAQGIPVLELASIRSYPDVRSTLTLLGEICGTEAESARIVADLDARVEKLKATWRTRPRVRILVYSNDGTGGWAAGTRTTAHAMIELCGLRNAGAEAGIQGHKAIDLERLFDLDPDLFVVAAPASGEGGSATRTILETTGTLQSLRAVRKKRIAVLPAALISADSPRLVDAAEALAAEVDRLYADVEGARIDDAPGGGSTSSEEPAPAGGSAPSEPKASSGEDAPSDPKATSDANPPR